ncbi:MAG: MauE/DoxX family redox-associated membrane protein [Candidatus Sumerlaeia bacterium]
MKKHFVGATEALFSIIVGCVFIISSISKIQQPYIFMSDIYGYDLVGPKTGVFLAIIFPWLELLIGICLIGRLIRLGALAISSIILSGFVIIQFYAIHQGLSISCGCFSSSNPGQVSYMTLARSVVLFIMSFLAYIIALNSGTYVSWPKLLGKLLRLHVGTD